MNLNQMKHMQSAYETFRVECEIAIKANINTYEDNELLRKFAEADTRLEKTLDIIRKELALEAK